MTKSEQEVMDAAISLSHHIGWEEELRSFVVWDDYYLVRLRKAIGAYEHDNTQQVPKAE